MFLGSDGVRPEGSKNGYRETEYSESISSGRSYSHTQGQGQGSGSRTHSSSEYSMKKMKKLGTILLNACIYICVHMYVVNVSRFS